MKKSQLKQSSENIVLLVAKQSEDKETPREEDWLIELVRQSEKNG